MRKFEQLMEFFCRFPGRQGPKFEFKIVHCTTKIVNRKISNRRKCYYGLVSLVSLKLFFERKYIAGIPSSIVYESAIIYDYFSTNIIYVSRIWSRFFFSSIIWNINRFLLVLMHMKRLPRRSPIPRLKRRKITIIWRRMRTLKRNIRLRMYCIKYEFNELYEFLNL